MNNMVMMEHMIGSGKAIKNISNVPDMFVDILWQYQLSENYADFGKTVEQILMDKGFIVK